jgi:hypothetical protein
VEGEEVSEDGCEDDEEGFWKSFAISALLIVGLGVEAVDVAGFEVVVLEFEGDDREGRAGCFDDPVADVVFPFTWFEDVAGTVPKDFITSVFTAGVEAGEEDNGAEASSIEPNITDPERLALS